LLILDTSKLSYDSMDLQVNRIDTIRYFSLPYWVDTMDRFYNVYIDTFTVDGNKFRFINPQENKYPSDILVYLEKLIDGQWYYTGFTLGIGNYVSDYYHSRDINGDGFNDITQNHKWNQAVYFYDPKSKTYKSNNKYLYQYEFYASYDYKLIDTSNNIFCDFFDGKQMCYDISSTLYKFDRNSKNTLYKLELYNCDDKIDDNHGRFITKLILYKCLPTTPINKVPFQEDSLVLLKEIKLSKPIDLRKNYDDSIGYFDYAAFWKRNYKQLLGYR
jgi:hypothetical protein